MKVNASDYGTSRPKLTQEDLEGDFTILTIAEVEEVTMEDDEKESGERKSLLLQFKETGDKSLWLNVTQVKALIAELGDDTDLWVGQQVPVEKYTGKFKGKKFEKVGVMDSDNWGEAFKTAGIKRKKLDASAPRQKPTAGKAGARR